MTFKNKTFQKFIALFLIISILSPVAFVTFSPPPQKAEAAWPTIDLPNFAQLIKDIIKAILTAFLRKIATTLLDKMTQSTLNWVNGGFQGAPLFIENPGTFFKGVVNTELRGFIDETAFDRVKFPFGKDYALGIIDSAKGKFAENAQYTLSKLYTNDPAEYAAQQNDFAAGGWGGVLMNTQNLQNNLIGYGILAEKEVQGRAFGSTSPLQQVRDKVDQGSGFLSMQTCKSNAAWDPKAVKTEIPYTPPSDPMAKMDYDMDYDSRVLQATQAYNKISKCPEGPSATTPGRVAADSVMNALGSKQRQGELSAQAGNALAAIFDSVINKVLDMGLTAVTNKIAGSGNPPTPDPLDVKLSSFNEFGDTGSASKQIDPATGKEVGYLGSPPTASNPKISVTVNIINDDGGQTYDPGIIQVYLDDNPIKTNSPTVTTVGNHLVTLQDLVGFYKMITGDCDQYGNVTLIPSEDAACTITLDDIPMLKDIDSGMMMIQLQLINDNGGFALEKDIRLLVDNVPVPFGVARKYQATDDKNQHNVSVTLPDKGYVLTYLPGCNAQGTIVVEPTCRKEPNGFLGLGNITICDRATQTCTVRLDDIPGWHQANFIVDVQVINDAPIPGTLAASQVNIAVDGSSSTKIAPIRPIVVGQSNAYTSGDTKTAPVHTITGTTIPGYEVSFTGDCDSKGTFQLAYQVVPTTRSCTVVYDDIN